MRYTNIRLMQWAGEVIAVAGLAVSAQMAGAQSCPTWATSCVEYDVAPVWDHVTITGSGIVPPDYNVVPVGLGSLGAGGAVQVPPSQRVRPGVSTRTTPECLRERQFQDTVDNALGMGNMQGDRIMEGIEMGDPALLQYGRGWEKYEVRYVLRDMLAPWNVLANITVHYEYQPSSGRYTSPPHFVTSSVTGCRNGG